jgi:hypothetical protein
MYRSVVFALAGLVPALTAVVSAQALQSSGAPPAPIQTKWTIVSESLAEGSFFSTTWSSDLPYDTLFQITDLYVASDRFEVYDNGVLVLTTPAVPDWDGLGAADPYVAPPFAYDPDAAFGSGVFSAGSLAPPVRVPRTLAARTARRTARPPWASRLVCSRHRADSPRGRARVMGAHRPYSR